MRNKHLLFMLRVMKMTLSLKGLAKAEVLSYIVPGMQMATD